MKDIYINRHDLERLRRIMADTKVRRTVDERCLRLLDEELARGIIFDPDKTPEDVVTMHSVIRTKNLTTGAEEKYWLVFPDKTQGSPRRLSILSPLGVALFGCREGDEIECDDGGNMKKIRIEEVLYQPERMGNFVL
jgi:regulator of nucleoside diphosphate kinase